MKAGMVASALALACSTLALGQDRLQVTGDGAEAATRIPPVKLDRPNWRPLRGAEIKATLSGKTLLLDEDFYVAPSVKVKPFYDASCPPIEDFAPDGAWRRVECGEHQPTFTGRWEIESFNGGERLCVGMLRGQRLCRLVWRGAAPDQIFMGAFDYRRDKSMDRPSNYNPYRLIATPPQRVKCPPLPKVC